MTAAAIELSKDVKDIDNQKSFEDSITLTVGALIIAVSEKQPESRISSILDNCETSMLSDADRLGVFINE